MTVYLNAPESGVKSYSEGMGKDGKPESITAYFTTGAYTYTKESVGELNFENMTNLAHDGIGLCRYITRNCRFQYASKVKGRNIRTREGNSRTQSSSRLQGYWSGRTITHGNTYNLDRPTVSASRIKKRLEDRGLPSGITRNLRGKAQILSNSVAIAKPRIKLKVRPPVQAKPRIKLKLR